MPENAVSALVALEGVNIRNFPRRRRIPAQILFEARKLYTDQGRLQDPGGQKET
jgi:hypothetical protein